jgi:Zn-finger nucleic acid-binding protein
VKCPVCDVTLLISSREGIEIDHCPQCRGVWLDRGELDKIIERAAPQAVGVRSDRDSDWEDRRRDERYRDERYGDDRYRRDDDFDEARGSRPRRKRRGSVLEDIFDCD